MFTEIKTLFSRSFLLTKLKEEAEFDIFFQSYPSIEIAEKIDQYLHDAFLSSVKSNYQAMLTTTSEYGLKAYTNWKLSFPQHPHISNVSDSLNLSLRTYENELTLSLLKMLVFLKQNFSPAETVAKPFLLPFMTEAALNKRFPTLSSDFKIQWYERYIINLEKLVILKLLLSSSSGAIYKKFSHDLYFPSEDDSNLAKQIGFLNNKVKITLSDLNNTTSLLYQTRLAELTNHFSVIEIPVDQVEALSIEEEYSQTFSANTVSFKEDDCTKIFAALCRYFSEDEQPQLRDLIFRCTIEQGRKLIFQQSAIVLVYFFKRLYEEHSLVATSKQVMGRWITSNFKCLYKGQPIDIKEDTMKKYLKPDTKPPKLQLSID